MAKWCRFKRRGRLHRSPLFSFPFLSFPLLCFFLLLFFAAVSAGVNDQQATNDRLKLQLLLADAPVSPLSAQCLGHLVG